MLRNKRDRKKQLYDTTDDDYDPKKKIPTKNYNIFLIPLVLASLFAAYVGYQIYQRYTINNLTRKLNLPLVSDIYNQDIKNKYLWGSYRPNTYFGIKNAQPTSLLFGLMWYVHLDNGKIMPIRHWCEQDDKLTRYGWLSHDGLTFGEHEIIDHNFGIQANFVKQYGQSDDDNQGWTSKITVQNLPHTSFNHTVSLLVYAYIEENHENIKDSDNVMQNFLTTPNPDDIKNGKSHVVLGEIQNKPFFFTFRTNSPTKVKDVQSNNNNDLLLSEILHFADLRTRSKPKNSNTQHSQHVHYSAASLSNYVYDNLIMINGGAHEINQMPLITLPDTTVQRKTHHLSKHRNNFMSYQIIPSKLPISIEISYFAGDYHINKDVAKSNTANFDRHNQRISERKRAFDERYKRVFSPSVNHNLANHTVSKEDLTIAKAAFSNLIGGMGYFYGSSLVSFTQIQHKPASQNMNSRTKETIYEYFKAPLFSAVPSRSFFPRGFLWDEGFHQLIISAWDPYLSMFSLGSWFDLQNRKGWIPREQILGVEARAKVPQEFIVQRDQNANPPALFLAIDSLLKRYLDAMDLEPDGNLPLKMDMLKFWVNLYPRASKWFDWFNTSQSGLVYGTFRWRGRDPYAPELNPKTLTSGLDDYPRTTHPTAQDRHVDLRCWMAFASTVMAKMSQVLRDFVTMDTHVAKWDKIIKYANNTKYDIYSLQSMAKKYVMRYDQEHRFQVASEYLSYEPELVRLHWNKAENMFSDYGTHVPVIKLETKTIPSSNPHQEPTTLTKRVIPDGSPGLALRYVGREAFGYVSLFPLIFKILKIDSPKLYQLLAKDIPDTSLLWTNYGLRSLAKSSRVYYDAKNTPHDPPYWRGDVWININYLVLSAFHHYGTIKIDGKVGTDIAQATRNQMLAKDLYVRLRSNLIDTIVNNYKRTGFLWERYCDKTGRGKGAHPFTGWSALLSLIIAEKF